MRKQITLLTGLKLRVHTWMLRLMQCNSRRRMRWRLPELAMQNPQNSLQFHVFKERFLLELAVGSLSTQKGTLLGLKGYLNSSQRLWEECSGHLGEIINGPHSATSEGLVWLSMAGGFWDTMWEENGGPLGQHSGEEEWMCVRNLLGF